MDLGTYDHVVSDSGYEAHQAFFNSEYIKRQRLGHSATVSLNAFARPAWKQMNFLVLEFDDTKENWGSTDASLACLSKGRLDGVTSLDRKYINLDQVNSWKHG